MTVAEKAMIKLVAPAWIEPTKPVRIYYLAVNQGDTVPNPRLQTIERFEDGTLTKNIKVVDDIDCKMNLSEYAVKMQKCRKDAEAWTENSACVYHFVLTHCPPELEAEMQNYLMWVAKKTKQDCIDLLHWW